MRKPAKGLQDGGAQYLGPPSSLSPIKSRLFGSARGLPLTIGAAVLAVPVASNLYALQAAPTSSFSSVPDQVFAGKRQADVLRAQVLLDRAGFSPGAIDGYSGGNTFRAIRAFEEANGLTVDGKLDQELMKRLTDGTSEPVVQPYSITQSDVEGPFIDSVPDSLAEQAKLERLAYTGPAEMLAEKFHMSLGLLRAMNPNGDFKSAGTEINVVAPRRSGIATKIARIEVDKAQKRVRAYDEAGKLVVSYPATVGSRTLPSPSGSTQVRAVAQDAAYYFDPSKQPWGPDERLQIAAGPNNPVGGVWIDLEKEGYGIHGSPDPSLIGKTASHGCVRLTNWDARDLAAAVSKGVRVAFVG